MKRIDDCVIALFDRGTTMVQRRAWLPLNTLIGVCDQGYGRGTAEAGAYAALMMLEFGDAANVEVVCVDSRLIMTD